MQLRKIATRLLASTFYLRVASRLLLLTTMLASILVLPVALVGAWCFRDKLASLLENLLENYSRGLGWVSLAIILGGLLWYHVKAWGPSSNPVQSFGIKSRALFAPVGCPLGRSHQTCKIFGGIILFK